MASYGLNHSQEVHASYEMDILASIHSLRIMVVHWVKELNMFACVSDSINYYQ